MKRIKKKIEEIKEFFISLSKKIILPGFKGYSLYYVGSFFIKGMQQGAISIRASSVAFNLFIAVFPTLIFFFSLIPFIPVENFQYELFGVLAEVLPDTAYSLMHETISDTILNQRTSILSLGFFLMLFFASNGVMAFVEAFNNSYHQIDTRNWISKRLISIVLVIILSVLILVAITLMVTGNNFIVNFVSNHPFYQQYRRIIFFGVGMVKWLLIILMYFLATSFLYYLAPARKSRFRFITPGAILSTFLQIISSSGFAYYVNNFARYNKLYGSIGTVIVVMLLFYITSLALIIGFELNVSILTSKKNISIKSLEN